MRRLMWRNLMPHCDICNEEIVGLAYGLIPTEIEDSWIDVPVPADGIQTFVHYKCYSVVVRIYSQDIVDGFIDLDDPFGLKEKDNA